MLTFQDLQPFFSARFFPKTSQEKGTACPVCGGKDRLSVYLDSGKGFRVWCRQCGLQCSGPFYLHNYCGHSWPEAYRRLGVQSQNNRFSFSARQQTVAQQQTVAPIVRNPGKWQQAAGKFLEQCRHNLAHPLAIEALAKRGISVGFAAYAGIGYAVCDCYFDRADWGLAEGKKLFIPRGIVWACRTLDSEIKAIIIRRHEPYNGRRFLEVLGSEAKKNWVLEAMLPGMNDLAIITESTLDAVLLYDLAEWKVLCVAVCGVGNGIDSEAMELLRRCKRIAMVPDNDEAGIAAFWKLKSIFPNLEKWPVITPYKDFGELFTAGTDLQRWLQICQVYGKDF